ncbi:MAG: sodium ion-translocating decarboxylase subunit beta, partial [Clostridia bacterium]|nr:sodium ion-translocating decarboxylase subunit beta [Clostridia bacterium]
MLDTILEILKSTGIADLIADPWLLGKTLVMHLIVGVLVYLAIAKKFEPLLLLPIAFGMLLANLPGAEMMHMEELFLGK